MLHMHCDRVQQPQVSYHFPACRSNAGSNHLWNIRRGDENEANFSSLRHGLRTRPREGVNRTLAVKDLTLHQAVTVDMCRTVETVAATGQNMTKPGGVHAVKKTTYQPKKKKLSLRLQSQHPSQNAVASLCTRSLRAASLGKCALVASRWDTFSQCVLTRNQKCNA